MPGSSGLVRLDWLLVSYQLEGMVLGRASAAELTGALDALDRQAPGP
jgi:hypothetical protein